MGGCFLRLFGLVWASSPLFQAEVGAVFPYEGKRERGGRERGEREHFEGLEERIMNIFFW